MGRLPHLAPSHGSPHTCSFSQAWNSPRFGGLRKYPSRCFRSFSRSFDRAKAARSASRVKPDRVMPSFLAMLFTTFQFFSSLSGNLPGKPDDWNTHGACLSKLFPVSYKSCNGASDVCLDYLLPALPADACGYPLNDHQFAFDPELLLDASLLHPTPAHMAFSIIIHR